MTNQTKLNDLITKAVDGGCQSPDVTRLTDRDWSLKEDGRIARYPYTVQKIDLILITHLNAIFFDPSFLKALFGESKMVCAIDGSDLDDQPGKHQQCVMNKHFSWDHDFIPAWEYEAMNLAITPPSERLRVLWEVVND